MPYMEYRMDEITSKTRMWDSNMNFWHDCKESPQAKKKKKDEEFQKELLGIRKQKVALLTTSIFCFHCQKSVKPIKPCKHMLEDGFEVGVDGSDFYSDSYKAKARRKLLKKQKKTKKKISLDSFK